MQSADARVGGESAEAVDSGRTRPDSQSTGNKRVLLCTDYLPPSDGGVEQVVGQLAHRLNERGHDVGLFTLRSNDERIDLADHPDITIYASAKIDLTPYVGLQSAVSIPALWDFRRVASQFEPDVVHVHNRFFYTSYVGLLYKPLTRVPLVTTLHLGDLSHIDGRGGDVARVFESVFARLLVRHSDAVLCVSDSVSDVARFLGARTTETVPNSVDLDQFAVSNADFDKTLLYVGRLVRNNGPMDLVRAVPAIVEEHPDAHVHIVGDGELKGALERLVRSLSLSESVTIHGFVDDVVSMYEAADVFCRPSYSEGLPLTLLEAMATYTVPVVTPIAGANEVLSDGETGYFVGVANPESIASTVSELFSNADDVDRVAEAARTYVERRHSWDQRVENITQLYRSVTDEHV